MLGREVGREKERLSLILPADLTGKTLLDIGASEGGFCYEALHRGAIYATAIESRDTHVALMRRIRDAWQLPMTVAQMDVVNQSLPVLTTHGPKVIRYSLALLLNVLHHCQDPKALLEKVLAVCDSVVIETPFTAGCEPHPIGLPPYPFHLGLPPEWVKHVGAASGFTLDAIEISSMMEGQRLLYKLRRVP